MSEIPEETPQTRKKGESYAVVAFRWMRYNRISRAPTWLQIVGWTMGWFVMGAWTY